MEKMNSRLTIRKNAQNKLAAPFKHLEPSRVSMGKTLHSAEGLLECRTEDLDLTTQSFKNPAHGLLKR